MTRVSIPALAASLLTLALAAGTLEAQGVGNDGNNSDTQRETRPGVLPGTVVDGSDAADGVLPGPAPAPTTPTEAECQRILAQAEQDLEAPAPSPDSAAPATETAREAAEPNLNGTADPEHAIETDQRAILEACRRLDGNADGVDADAVERN